MGINASPYSNRAITFAIVVRLIRRLVSFERQIRIVVPPIARTLAGRLTLGRWDGFPSLVIILFIPWQEPLRDAVAIGFGAVVEKLSVA